MLSADNPKKLERLKVGSAYEDVRFGKNARTQRMHLRERKLVEHFMAELPANQLVLDCPCGMGRFTDLVIGAGHRLVSMDLSFDHVSYAAHRTPQPTLALRGSVLELPLRDQSIDVALCVRLLHHLQPREIISVLSELSRVAKRAYVTFYWRGSVKYLKKAFQGKDYHGQFYDRATIRQLCAEAGWTDFHHERPFDVLNHLHFLRLARPAAGHQRRAA